MSNCDICNINITTNSKRFSSNDFKNIIKNGFNPFKENITYPTGMKISEMGAAMGLSEDEQYSQWKTNAIEDNTDWILCPQCFPYADKFKR
ncbi:MAG: hypothetical protein GY699_08275 [Desulfobacteraceae bacterium]|nr:hypothetical protein [Desulfobacteraceae bacterium]